MRDRHETFMQINVYIVTMVISERHKRCGMPYDCFGIPKLRGVKENMTAEVEFQDGQKNE